MRDSFAREMTAIAAQRRDVTLLSGDIGNRMFDRFKEVAPERFLRPRARKARWNSRMSRKPSPSASNCLKTCRRYGERG